MDTVPNRVEFLRSSELQLTFRIFSNNRASAIPNWILNPLASPLNRGCNRHAARNIQLERAGTHIHLKECIWGGVGRVVCWAKYWFEIADNALIRAMLEWRCCAHRWDGLLYVNILIKNLARQLTAWDESTGFNFLLCQFYIIVLLLYQNIYIILSFFLWNSLEAAAAAAAGTATTHGVN